jgi:hypothetical protein
MRIQFKLEQPLAGFVATSPDANGGVWVCQRELVGPTDPHLTDRLEKLHDALFSRIPGLPPPSQIDHIVVTISQDLSATAVLNELLPKAQIKVKRAVNAGEPVYVRDIDDISAVDLGMDIPADSAVIVFRSFNWRRSLFFDVTPLGPGKPSRERSLDAVLAQQMLLLFGIPIGTQGYRGPLTRAEHMAQGVARLEQLLYERCEAEAQYQELLAQHPWMLGQPYTKVVRHQPFDDSSIPDFTAVRCYDECHDIIELKQPFITLFKGSGQFGAGFNDAWNQAEGYLSYTIRNRGYLLQEKGLRFEDPKCLLVCGEGLSSDELSRIREKTSLSGAISVITYDQLLGIARHIVDLVRTAGDLQLPAGPVTLRSQPTAAESA